MNVLWFAFGIYIVGVSALLILQPRIMFEQNVWKEFGLHNSTKTTVFPVWMFIMVWSLLSYGAASLVVTGFSNIAGANNIVAPAPYVRRPLGSQQFMGQMQQAQQSQQSQQMQQEEQEQSQQQEQAQEQAQAQESQEWRPEQSQQSQSIGIKNSLPFHRRRLRRRLAKPGYYIRNDSVANGPKYIYYGDEPPQ